MKKRIGKDLVTRFTVLTDGEATALAGRDLTLELRHNTLSLAYQLAFTIENTNSIVFTWYGKTQEKTGSYTLTLWENKGKVGMTAIDIPYVELVSWTYAEVGNTGDTPSTSSVNLGSANLETTGRGYSAYECWLQAGHTGTISDYFAFIKGEKGDKGDKGDTPVMTASDDGTLYADGALLTTIIKDTCTLATLAAANASTKATLADTAADNADTKAALAAAAATNANDKATEAHQAAVSAGLKVFCTQAQYDEWKEAGTLRSNYEYNIYEEE